MAPAAAVEEKPEVRISGSVMGILGELTVPKSHQNLLSKAREVPRGRGVQFAVAGTEGQLKEFGQWLQKLGQSWIEKSAEGGTVSNGRILVQEAERLLKGLEG